MKNIRIFGRIAICCILVGCISTINAQTLQNQKEQKETLEVLMKYFKDIEEQERKTGLIHVPGAYKPMEISNTPIALDIKEIVLENPYGNGFPVSYSVIYKDRLVSLFEPGLFVCHSIQTMERDLLFEKKINTKNFEYHWLIDNQLVGLSKEKYYYLDTKDKWVELKKSIPLWNQPKLFEDAKYISFCDWGGEWGGTVYFFNKSTGKIYFTEATDANTVFEKNGKYYVLYELGHLTMVRSSLKEIPDPDLLTPISLEEVRQFSRGRGLTAIGYSDTSNASSIVFSIQPIQLFSTFVYKGRTVYLTDSFERTFLAEKEDNVIKIVTPLFNSDLCMHYPVTTNYSNTILINRAWYMVGGKREISCFIIKDEEFIKIDWNKGH